MIYHKAFFIGNNFLSFGWKLLTKKLLLFAIILGGAVAFTSCGKDECECTVFGTTETYTEDDLAEGENMKDACNEADAGVALFGGSCELK